MRRILVFQHVAHELLGILNPKLKNAGFGIRYVNFGRKPDAKPSLRGYTGLVVLGGPMNVDEEERHPHLRTEIALIEEALKKEIPVLGICLGAQLIAKTLGARVGRNHVKEIGWYEVIPTPEGLRDPVVKHLAVAPKIFQWHGDTFEIPSGAAHLASSQTCPHQAFRYRDNVYGFQFHVEVDLVQIKKWLARPELCREAEAFGGAGFVGELLNETGQHVARAVECGNHIFDSYIACFGTKSRTELLGSG